MVPSVLGFPFSYLPLFRPLAIKSLMMLHIKWKHSGISDSKSCQSSVNKRRQRNSCCCKLSQDTFAVAAFPMSSLITLDDHFPLEMIYYTSHDTFLTTSDPLHRFLWSPMTVALWGTAICLFRTAEMYRATWTRYFIYLWNAYVSSEIS